VEFRGDNQSFFSALKAEAQAGMAGGHVFPEAVGEAGLQLHVVVDPNRAAQCSAVLALECAQCVEPSALPPQMNWA